MQPAERADRRPVQSRDNEGLPKGGIDAEQHDQDGDQHKDDGVQHQVRRPTMPAPGLARRLGRRRPRGLGQKLCPMLR